MDILLISDVSLQVILLRSEAYQAIFVNVEAQRVDRGDRHVEPEIELVPVDQERFAHILTDDQLSSIGDLVHILSDEDTLALRAGGRFADPAFLGVL